MPQMCTVCRHEQLEEINKALVAGEPLRDVALRVTVGVMALHRHKGKCLPTDLLKSKAVQAVTRADTLLEQLVTLQDKALAILSKAEKAGDLRTALMGVREAKGCLELLARLRLELQDRSGPRELCIRVVFETAEEAKESETFHLRGVR